MGFSLAPVVAVLLSITPGNGGVLTPTRVTINNQPGDQFDPHVDGDLAAYSSSTTVDQIRYYRFSTGVDSVVPAPMGAIDLLSDIDSERVVFTRVTDKNAIMLFDVATGAVTELAPAPNSNRVGVGLGGQTAAFIDYSANPNAGEVMVLNLTDNVLTRLTNDNAYDQSPAVSPDGNVVVWETCTTGALCDVYAARRNGATWLVDVISSHPLRDTAPDSNGSLVVFQRDDAANPGPADIVVVPVNGGAETVLEIPGAQYNPSIRGNIVAFEGRPNGGSESDLFLVELTSNRIFQITATPGVNETLNDVTVLPNGDVRVVWQASQTDNVLFSDIYGATFALPPVPGTCTPRSKQLEAWRTYRPSRWFDDDEALTPPMTFTIPAELPVVAGNAGNKTAYLTFEIGNDTVSCKYVGGSRKAHPKTPSDVADGLRYEFSRCTLDGHGHGNGGGGNGGGGCNRNDDDDDEDDDDDHHGNGGGDDDDDDDEEDEDDGHGNGPASNQWVAGATITASRVKLHVHDGDSWKPLTKVRVTLDEVCPAPGAPPPTNPPLPPTAPPHRGPHHGGCSSTGDSLMWAFGLMAFALLSLRRRPLAIAVVTRNRRP